MKLSIIVPVFNEEKTIELVLRKLASLDLGEWEKEIIVVDDGSLDGSKKIISDFAKASSDKENLKFLVHSENFGKGAAIKTALEHAIGDAVIIQDADLEYNPEEFNKLLSVFQNPEISAVYGSRNLNPKRRGYPHYVLGVAILSGLTNILYGSALTDVYTCYKLFRSDVLKNLNIQSSGFEFEAEVTSKLLRSGHKILETPISYSPRKFSEGKKIRFKDAVVGFWTILKNRF
ncbi:MAG: glycosyltransferase family 2 protein [Patescibacteria group bacterium]